MSNSTSPFSLPAFIETGLVMAQSAMKNAQRTLDDLTGNGHEVKGAPVNGPENVDSRRGRFCRTGSTRVAHAIHPWNWRNCPRRPVRFWRPHGRRSKISTLQIRGTWLFPCNWRYLWALCLRNPPYGDL